MNVETVTAAPSAAADTHEAVPTPAAIEVTALRKSFRIPTQRVDTLKERATGMFSRREYRNLDALRGVDFVVRQGEFFGIVGRNGSGKSTLLKLLASIYRADGGRIRIAGRVAPCIELGVGFNPELTAQDNVALNGVMMGLSPAEARSRYDAVIDFAELRDYTDVKLKNYSSGMLVRLGFSLMTQVDADVLLIDEVLAVGDAAFQQKCFDVFARLHSQGKTIILVTHDMASVETHCDRAILLENGVIELEGDSAEVARRYLEVNFPGDRAMVGPEDVHVSGAERVVFSDVALSDETGAPATSFAQGDRIGIEVTVEAVRRVDQAVVGFQIVSADGLLVFEPRAVSVGEGGVLEAGERIRFTATVANPLAAGHYYVHFGVARRAEQQQQQPVAFRKNAADFVVFGTRQFGGLVELAHETTVAPLADRGRE